LPNEPQNPHPVHKDYYGTLPPISGEFEFGRYAEGSVPEALLHQATRALVDYLVSFGVDDLPSGSATLVVVDDKPGFLTAAHVVDDLMRSRSVRVAIICAEYPHQLLLSKENLLVCRYGPTEGEFPGPDLAFIHLQDLECLGVLKARKSFYPLLSNPDLIFPRIQPRGAALCFIAGAPEEMSTELGVRKTPSHILGTKHFLGRAQVSDEFITDGFDYLKLGILAGQDGFPANFGGVSGGGIWHIPLCVNPDVGLNSITFTKPELVGVAFYQSALSGRSRTILGHGPKQLYSLIAQQLGE
jgi:hypothetical protein